MTAAGSGKGASPGENITLYLLEDVGFEARWEDRQGAKSAQVRGGGQREKSSLAAVRTTRPNCFSGQVVFL